MSKRDPLTTNVIACKWRRTEQGWELWVKGRKDVCGAAATYEDAEDLLINAIMDAAPDLDAVLPVVPEFDPPLPTGAIAEPYLTPELFLIQGDEFFDLHRPSHFSKEPSSDPDLPAFAETPERRQAYLDSLFEGGICPTCRDGRGERTDVPLRPDGSAIRTHAGWIRAPFRAQIRVFSERFLDLLSADERDRFKFRPIETPPGTRRKFYELRGPAEVPYVGVRGLDADGFDCPHCGHYDLRVLDPELMKLPLYLTHFVSVEDLPRPPVSCFTVGLGNQIDLCMTRQRWDSLRGRPETRSVTTTRVGAVSAEACERQPRVRNRKDRCEVCVAWPEPRSVRNTSRAIFDLPATYCSFRNFTWFDDAESSGHIRISRATMSPAELFECARRTEKPRRIEYVSFRCLNCWRLGWVVLWQNELHLAWETGLW